MSAGTSPRGITRQTAWMAWASNGALLVPGDLDPGSLVPWSALERCVPPLPQCYRQPLPDSTNYR
jgi:hypothetical protein